MSAQGVSFAFLGDWAAAKYLRMELLSWGELLIWVVVFDFLDRGLAVGRAWGVGEVGSSWPWGVLGSRCGTLLRAWVS